MNRRALTAAALLATLILMQGCGGTAPKPDPVQGNGARPAAAAPGGGSIRLRDTARELGINFSLGHNGRSPLTILETAGGGGAFADFDGDGWPDLILAGPHRVALYRNIKGRRFADITAGSRIRSNGYWMGCTTGDYNGDGRIDLFLTGYRCAALYRNEGGGRFTDVTAAAGLPASGWSLSAALADVDLDGDLDLYVSGYVDYGPHTLRLCRLGSIESACGPEVYRAQSGMLYLNENGRFAAVPGWRDTGKTWGVLVSRLTEDRRPGIYLANDMMPGDLWVHRGGRWRNIGPETGTAYDAQGHLQGGMGIDSGDYNNDGLLDLIVTTFFAQPTSLYRGDGGDLFTPVSGPAGLVQATTPLVAFGVALSDLDCDGYQDLVIASGHVRDNIAQFDGSQSYPQPLLVLRNERGRFVDVSSTALDSPHERLVGRGLSTGDYDRDGRPDVLVCDLEGRARLLHNESTGGNWLALELRSPGKNRHGLGALVRARQAGRSQIRELRTNGSVLSALEPAVHFGFGEDAGAIDLDVEWPAGGVTHHRLQPNRRVLLNRR